MRDQTAAQVESLDATPPETATDVFSLAGLIEWLETQPGGTRYVWSQCDGDCLIGHYYAALGTKTTELYSKVFRGHLDDYSDVCLTRPWTYAAALTRARRLLAEQESA